MDAQGLCWGAGTASGLCHATWGSQSWFPQVLAGPQIAWILPWPVEHTWAPLRGSGDASSVTRERRGDCSLCEVSFDFSYTDHEVSELRGDVPSP